MKLTHIATPGKNISSSALHLEQLLAKDWVCVLLLLVTGLITRIPSSSQILYHWDSVNFAYAIQEFNVAKEQPQAPGYIVYVWLTRLVDGVIGDAQVTLVTISIISSILATVAMFYLGRAVFDRRVGLIGALLLATSPLFWFYSEIALPHTLDTLLVIVCVWWLYKTMRGNYSYLYPAIACAALAGGIRQQTLVFLAPLLLFALRRVGWKRFFSAGLLGAGLCLAWFIPLIVLSDGLANYLHVVGEFGRRFQSTTSILEGAGWWGVRRNAIKLALYTLYGWSVGLLPAMIYIIYRIRRREWPRHWETLIFLWLWMIPALVFYALIHMGQQGLVFVFLPALLLITAAGLSRIPYLYSQPYRLALATTVLVLINMGVFHLISEYPLGADKQRLLTRSTLINNDQYYQERFNLIKENFAPESTVILAANWHHVEYYLPEYHKLPFNIGSKWEVNEGIARNSPDAILMATPEQLGLSLSSDGIATVIVFDPELDKFNDTPELTKQVGLLNGDLLTYLELRATDHLYLQADSFGLRLE